MSDRDDSNDRRPRARGRRARARREAARAAGRRARAGLGGARARDPRSPSDRSVPLPWWRKLALARAGRARSRAVAGDRARRDRHHHGVAPTSRPRPRCPRTRTGRRSRAGDRPATTGAVARRPSGRCRRRRSDAAAARRRRRQRRARRRQPARCCRPTICSWIDSLDEHALDRAEHWLDRRSDTHRDEALPH